MAFHVECPLSCRSRLSQQGEWQLPLASTSPSSHSDGSGRHQGGLQLPPLFYPPKPTQEGAQAGSCPTTHQEVILSDKKQPNSTHSLNPSLQVLGIQSLWCLFLNTKDQPGKCEQHLERRQSEEKQSCKWCSAFPPTTWLPRTDRSL